MLFVRLVKVDNYHGTEISAHFIQAALYCPIKNLQRNDIGLIYTVRFTEIILQELDQKTAGAKIFVRSNKVFALEHVCLAFYCNSFVTFIECVKELT